MSSVMFAISATVCEIFGVELFMTFILTIRIGQGPM